MIIDDPYFQVKVLDKCEFPQTVSYMAAHQDYSENFAFDEFLASQSEELNHYKDPFKSSEFLSEKEAGERLVKHCIKFRHWGVVEHPWLVLNAGYFPHEVLQQARTHRIMSFDVQSGRYSGQRICALSRGEMPESEIEKIFYLRPAGEYTNRQGAKYEYTEKQRNEDLDFLWCAVHAYRLRIDQGFSEEHARQVYCNYALRQHFVFSANLRSWLHFIDVRHKEDVQLECKTLAYLVWDIIKNWVPEIAEHYESKRLNKNQLAP